MTCEKCWTDAGGDAMAYAALVRERTESGESCTPREQCGERHTKGGDDLCACRRAKQKAERGVIDAAKIYLAADEHASATMDVWVAGNCKDDDAKRAHIEAVNAFGNAYTALKAAVAALAEVPNE